MLPDNLMKHGVIKLGALNRHLKEKKSIDLNVDVEWEFELPESDDKEDDENNDCDTDGPQDLVEFEIVFDCCKPIFLSPDQSDIDMDTDNSFDENDIFKEQLNVYVFFIFFLPLFIIFFFNIFHSFIFYH